MRPPSLCGQEAGPPAPSAGAVVTGRGLACRPLPADRLRPRRRPTGERHHVRVCECASSQYSG